MQYSFPQLVVRFLFCLSFFLFLSASACPNTPVHWPICDPSQDYTSHELLEAPWYRSAPSFLRSPPPVRAPPPVKGPLPEWMDNFTANYPVRYVGYSAEQLFNLFHLTILPSPPKLNELFFVHLEGSFRNCYPHPITGPCPNLSTATLSFSLHGTTKHNGSIVPSPDTFNYTSTISQWPFISMWAHEPFWKSGVCTPEQLRPLRRVDELSDEDMYITMWHHSPVEDINAGNYTLRLTAKLDDGMVLWDYEADFYLETYWAWSWEEKEKARGFVSDQGKGKGEEKVLPLVKKLGVW